MSNDQWQPIETAPMDGTQFLATDKSSMAVGCFYDETSYSYDFRISHFAISQYYGWKPTHWMPLPDAPRDNTGD
jgi:hypothetical protein